MMNSQKIDAAQEALKAAPPIAVTASSTLFGHSLNDWVAIFTIGYIILQAGWLLWKWYRAAKKKEWAPKDD